MAPADQLTDAQVVGQVLAGDQAQYRLIVERHQRAVFNAAYRLVGSQDEAADVAQEAFIRAYQALNSFQRHRPMSPWLCRIAINVALNRLKRRRPQVSLDDDWQSPALEVPDQSTDPQRSLLQAEQQQLLRQAIMTLPAEQRVIIELRHFQGLSYDDIASELDISLANVKSRLFRARKKLRQILEEDT